MKKYITFGLMISLVGGACFAQHPRIAQLIAEKQSKMKKLEDCQGTTKKLKIAGISTLGITAVGVGANIAEAVVLKNTKEDVEKAKKARDAQQKIKDDREAAKRQKNTVYENGECGDCKSNYIKDENGNCVKKPEPAPKPDEGASDAGKQGGEQGDKKSGDKGNAGQGGKEQNEAKKGDAGEPAPAGGEPRVVIPGQEQSCDTGWRWNSISKQCEKLGENGEENFGQCGDGAFFDGFGCVTLNPEPETPKPVSCSIGYKFSNATGKCEKLDQDFVNAKDLEKADYDFNHGQSVSEPEQTEKPQSPQSCGIGYELNQFSGECEKI